MRAGAKGRLAWAAALAAAVAAAAAAPSGTARADGTTPAVGVGPLPVPVLDADFHPVDEARARLGQLLFYDPVLSGNRDIACATCHHPRYGTSDGLSLGLGTGAVGLGPSRRPAASGAPPARLARNAPALWNLGARSVVRLFHDGRIEADPAAPGGFRTLLDPALTAGFDDLLALQAMFPLLGAAEMAGRPGENEIADALAAGRVTGPDGATGLIAARVAAIPAYRELFADLAADGAEGTADGPDPSFHDIARALAAFIAFEFRSDDSPYDRHLWGEELLAGPARAGKDLFFDRAGCVGCHGGPFLTDHAYHPMGQPQLGPGTGDDPAAPWRDLGRARVTGAAADAHAFRTPSLRNVAVTGPWGHAGAFADLRAFLRHHADPVRGLAAYRPQAALPPLPGAEDWRAMEDDATRAAIAAAARTPPVALTEAELDLLLAFLESLTDATALGGRLGIPDAVPSGLPVPR